MTYRERIRSARGLADELEAAREGEPFASARAWMSKAFEFLLRFDRWVADHSVVMPADLVAFSRDLQTWRVAMSDNYPAGPDRSRSISLLRAIAKDLEDVVAKNVELTKGPGRSRMVEVLRKRAAEERKLAAQARGEDPGGAVDNPHPGDYAAGVLEQVANEIEQKTTELRRGGW